MVERQFILEVRPATTDDLAAVKALADANRTSIGFVLRPTLAEAIARQWLYVAAQSNVIVGFVHFRLRRDGWTTIYEICVDITARRQGIGRALLLAVLNVSTAHGQQGIRLKCPVDSPANHFYAAQGMQRMGEEPGKHRALVLWTWKGA